jgi:hypothetical protein
MALSEVTVPFERSFDFGIGLDSTNASPMGKAVQGEVTGVSKAGGATVGFEITRIRSTHELEEKLGVDVKASYSAGPFANVSGRFSFAQSSKIQTSSLFMAITSNILLGHDSIDDPQLSPAAAALVDNPEMFRLRFGDMFVRGMDRGGLFIAVMKLETSDTQTSESISSQLSGAYGLFSGEAKQNFDKVQKDFHSELSIQVYHEGGPSDLIITSLDDPGQFLTMLQTWMKSFVDAPDKMAVPYSATLAPIAIANGPLPLNAADAEHARDVLMNCAKQRSAMMDGMNLMDAIIHAPARYTFTPPISMADIRTAASGYQEDLQLIAATASAAMNHPASAKMPAVFAADSHQAFPQGIPPSPMPELEKGMINSLQERGRIIAQSDPLLMSLHDLEPVGANRSGFEVGLAVDEGGTAQGPGKEKFKNDLGTGFSKEAFQRAVDFMMDRNANADTASRGSAAVAANAAATAARAKLPLSNQWLGFNIAAGLFGSVADGALGHTLQGPGSNKIRERLGASARVGYDSARAFYGVS